MYLLSGDNTQKAIFNCLFVYKSVVCKLNKNERNCKNN